MRVGSTNSALHLTERRRSCYIGVCDPHYKATARLVSFLPYLEDKPARTLARVSFQGTYFSEIEPMPAATFKPLFPETLSGCSENDLSKPPTSTLAPTPTPAVALALTPT